MLRDDINNAVKDAMKAKEERKLSTLRMVNSTLKNADIEARGQGKPPLSDADVLGVLQKMIKQRQESVELYDKGGRAELAAQERQEIAIISAYLPQQMSEDETKSAIAAEIAATGAAGIFRFQRGDHLAHVLHAGRTECGDLGSDGRLRFVLRHLLRQIGGDDGDLLALGGGEFGTAALLVQLHRLLTLLDHLLQQAEQIAIAERRLALAAGLDIGILDGRVDHAQGRELSLLFRLHGLLDGGIDALAQHVRLLVGVRSAAPEFCR